MFDFKKMSIHFFQYFRKSARKSKRIGRLLEGLCDCFKYSALLNQTFTWLKPIQTKNHFVILEFLYTHNEVAYFEELQEQPLRCVLRKRCSENMQQIYRRQPCRSAISIKLLCKFIEIELQHGCSSVNFLHIFGRPFPRNTSGWLLLELHD